MASLSVGGVAIPIAPQGANSDKDDLSDRGRVFDGTYRASVTGNPKRMWSFSTPPLHPAVAEIYETALSIISSQVCSGDLLGGSSNLLLFPEELDNAAWTKAGSTILANNALAPNGTVTGDKIQEDASGGNHGVTQAVTLPLATYKFSTWLSSVERTKALVMMADGAGGFAGTGVDLSAGTMFATGFSLGSWTAVTSTLSVPIPTASWYLATVTATRGAGTVTTPEILLWTTSASYAGSVGSGLHAWQAKLSNETSSVTCCSQVTGHLLVKTASGHRVVLSFQLSEV